MNKKVDLVRKPAVGCGFIINGKTAINCMMEL